MSYQSLSKKKKTQKFLEFTYLNINPSLYNYIQILFLPSTASKSPSGCSFQRKKGGGRQRWIGGNNSKNLVQVNENLLSRMDFLKLSRQDKTEENLYWENLRLGFKVRYTCQLNLWNIVQIHTYWKPVMSYSGYSTLRLNIAML